MSKVTVDPGRSLGLLDRNIFGGFVEHLGRCINGGLFEEGSPLSDAQGFRTDVLDLLRPLKLSVLRWPGGNFVSNYLWTDGIGPRASRPRRVELAWGGVEPNHFGTDEFLQYCEALGVTPYICLNMGTGTLSEALSWVEYCNSAAKSYWADRRRENGRAEPYGVPYWGLGNEIYGDWQVGQLSADEYVKTASRWAKAIRRLDPSIKLVSCGMNGWNDWDRVVIEGLSALVDLHSLHIYTGSGDYWNNVLSPHQSERAIRYTSTCLARTAYTQRLNHAPGIAYDEWNVWYRTDDGALEERYSFVDALAVATYLNIFVRNCAWVKMANLAQMVNAIAPIVTTTQGSFVQPIYYPFQLHAESALDEAVDARVESPTVEGPVPQPGDRWRHRIADLGPFATIDASATTDTRRSKLSATIVNRDPGSADAVELRLRDGTFAGPARVRTMTGTDRATNIFSPGTGENPGSAIEGVNLEDGVEQPRGDVLVVKAPPSSFTVIEVPISEP
jgi:alpha-N-arabinofuranosidase